MVDLFQREFGVLEAIGFIGAALVCYGILKILLRYWKFLVTPLRKIPGPKRGFLLGCYPEIRAEPYLSPHKKWIAEAGYDAKLLHYTTILGRSSLLILDKEIIRQILTSQHGKKNFRFRKDLAFIENVVGKGLFILDGEDWMRHRRLLQPAFHAQTIKTALEKTVPEKMEEFLGYWKIAADQGREIDVQTHFSALTLDIIGPTAFSYECNGLAAIKEWSRDKEAQNTELDDPLLNALGKAFKFDLLSTLCFVMNTPRLDGLRKTKRYARDLLNAETDNVVSCAKSKGKNSVKSVLSLLLEAEDGLTSEELRDEVKSFFVAGHETTSTWCLWAVYCMAKHKDVQDKVYRDIMKHASKTDRIGVDQAERMEYLNAFLQEVLRLYPPVGFTTRITNYPERLNDVNIPAGTRLTLSPHLMHRSPLYWDDPESFTPERWINVSSEETERRRFAYFPFSLGGRNCIGSRFATMEASMIMASLVRDFRVEIAPSQATTDHTFMSRVTMKTKPDLKIVVKNR